MTRLPTPISQDKRRLVHVEWEDASGPANVGWYHIHEYDFGSSYTCWSVGWIVAETARHLYLAPHFGNIDSDHSDNEQMTGALAIPKKMIRRMLRLTGLKRQ